MEWVAIAIVTVILYVIRNLEEITIKFKKKSDPPKIKTTVIDKQLEE